LVGCSANTFKDPVTAFGTSVGVVSSAVEQYETTSSEYALRATAASLLQSRDLIYFDGRNCPIGAVKTQCFITYDDNGKSQPLIAPKKIDAAKLSTALKTYSDGLTGIVNATTADDLGKGIDNVSDALKALGTDAGPTSKSAFLTDVGPITTVVKFVATNYVEYRRLQILQMAVERADPTIQRSTVKLARLVGEQQRAVVKLQANAIGENADLYNSLAQVQPDPPKDQNQTRENEEKAGKRAAVIVEKTVALHSALAGQARLQELIKSDVQKAILSMGQAHTKLATALKNPNVSLKDLYDALEKFYSDAKAAFDAIEKIK
jgi:hypothetical protein